MLVGPREAGNIGAAARALKNLGFSRLGLVAPEKYPSDEAVWFAHGALDVLEKTQVFENLEDAVKGKTLVVGATRRTGKQRGPVYRIKEAALKIRQYAGENKAAILFGREDRGLLNAETGECAFLINIPADAKMPSYNLSQAVLLVAYELSFAKGEGEKRKKAPARLASREEMQYFYERLEKSLDMLDYVPRGNKDMEITILRNIKHILGRAGIAGWELRMLHGLLSQAEMKLKRQS